jgi:quercetin dioxygenase-like cupin family protein
VSALEVVRSAAVTGRGPVWGIATEELNATLLAWPPAHRVDPHRNDVCDVVFALLSGSVTLTVDEASHELFAGDVAVIPRGAVRAVAVGSEGARYLTVHRRREALSITPAPAR